jgi:hypothetical protein
MKRMLLLLLAGMILSFAQSNAQKWDTQHAPGLSQPDPEVAFSAVNPNVCWGIKATMAFNSRQSPQIFRTTNGGNSWDSVTVPGGGSGLEGSAIAAIDANTAWAVMWDRSNATGGGVFKTTNAGAGWTRDTTLFSVSSARPEGMHFFDMNNGVVFGDPRGGFWEIYTTTDGGAHWIRVPSANIPVPVSGDGAIVGQFASVGNNLWFGTLSRSVYKTTDRGITWSAARNVLGADGTGVSVAFKDVMNGLACSPYQNGGISNRIDGTTDGGATWTSLSPGSIPATPAATWIAYDPVSHVYVFGSHRGDDFPHQTNPGSSYSTDDGSSWIQIDALPHGSATFTSSGAGWSDGANDVVYKWVPPIPTAGLQLWLRADAGVDTLNGTVSIWHDQSGSGNDAIQASASRQPVLVAGVLNGKPAVRFDGVNDKLGFTGTTHMTQFSLFLVINNRSGSAGSVITFGANGDFGHQWFMGMQIPSGSDTIGMLGDNASIVAVGPGLAAYNQWRNLSVVANQSIWSTTLRWDGKDAHMFPGGSGPAFSVPLGDATGSGGGIGGADGVPYGTIQVKCDVAEVLVYNVALSDSIRKVIELNLATKYGLTFTGISVHQAESLSERFVLEQNYPNPFNPSTTIKFELPRASHVNLTVYDVLGRELSRLVNERMDAGYHDVKFDGSALASGVYFYRLQAGSYVQTKKLMLLR